MYNKKDIIEKFERLKNVSLQLKTEFVGLDDIIDELINSIESWYLFPHIQKKPTIINLWGMTGCGKTSLIIKFLELMNLDSYVKFDIGEWLDDDNLRYNITSQIRTINKDKNIPIFIFDEFQLGRTIDIEGFDISKSQTRVIWDLLDSGIYTIPVDDWSQSNFKHLFLKLKKAIHNGVIVKKGKITKKLDVFYKYVLDINLKTVEKCDISNDFIPKSYIYDIYNLISRFNMTYNDIIFNDENDIIDYICELDNENKIMLFLQDIIELSFKPEKYDFSNSLIINIGNLDDAYSITSDLDPDLDADVLYDITKNINLTNIKSSLLTLFRPEQISRLGNSHLIYKSFTKQQFTDIIIMDLNRVINYMKNEFNITTTFSDNIINMIYDESVYPTQGVRPVFSTIKNIIDSYVTKIISHIYIKEFNINKIEWNLTNDKKYEILLYNDNNLIDTFIIELKLKLSEFKQSLDNNYQAICSVHETGHIITSIFTTNNCPVLATSRSTVLGDGAVTYFKKQEIFSKNIFTTMITCYLGGYAAEELMFGENNITNGASGDIERATSIALSMLKNYGYNNIPAKYTHKDISASDVSLVLENKLDKQAENIIKDCHKEAKKIIKNNMNVFLDICDYLFNNTKIYEDKIKEIVLKYNKDFKFKSNDSYYDYKNILLDKIKEKRGN